MSGNFMLKILNEPCVHFCQNNLLKMELVLKTSFSLVDFTVFCGLVTETFFYEGSEDTSLPHSIVRIDSPFQKQFFLFLSFCFFCLLFILC